MDQKTNELWKGSISKTAEMSEQGMHALVFFGFRFYISNLLGDLL